MKTLQNIFVIILLFVFNSLKAQPYCGLVELVPNTSINQLLTFNDFSDYLGGITVNSAAKIRVRVQDLAIPDPLCSWNLSIIADNGGGGVPVTEWEELLSYGGSATNPLIALIKIRVRNSCATSINDNWQTFPLGVNTDKIVIIQNIFPIVNNAGSCVDNVNGPGDYLTNYDEYNFDIDIRVQPALNYNPGLYQLNLRFHLEENQ
jgi:hypothetical protein